MDRVLTGFHAIEERLAASRSPGGRLLMSRTGGRFDRLAEAARRAGIPVERPSETELDRIAGRGVHRGALLILAEAASEETTFEGYLARPRQDRELVLLLDGITDPHNLGAVLRSADQFEVDLVVAPSRRSARDTETVARTSSGASAYVPFAVVPNLVRCVEELQSRDFWVYGADMAGEPVDRGSLSGRVCLVLGSEGKGLSRLLRERCDGLVRIPSGGHVDSLNVSVAAGILLYEVRRQQGHFAKR